MRKYKSRNRESLIEQRNRNSLTHLMTNKELTIAEKRALVAERNPFLFLMHKQANITVPRFLDKPREETK